MHEIRHGLPYLELLAEEQIQTGTGNMILPEKQNNICTNF